MSMTFNTQIIAARGEEVSAGQVLKLNTINAPTASGGTTYGPGTSGQVLKSNGTTIYWTSDSDNDTKVTQAAAITTNANYPMILAYSTATSAVTNTVNKCANITANPSTGTINATGLSGSTLASCTMDAGTY